MIDGYIYKQTAIDAVHKSIFDFFDICDDDEESPMTYKDERLLELNKAITNQIKALPSADVQILSSLLAELTHKERTDRYHVWTTHEVKQWIADKITEMKNDG